MGEVAHESSPSLYVSDCHGAYITPMPGTDFWRCHDCDKSCVPVRHDRHPRWNPAALDQEGHDA